MDIELSLFVPLWWIPGGKSIIHFLFTSWHDDRVDSRLFQGCSPVFVSNNRTAAVITLHEIVRVRKKSLISWSVLKFSPKSLSQKIPTLKNWNESWQCPLGTQEFARRNQSPLVISEIHWICSSNYIAAFRKWTRAFISFLTFHWITSAEQV